MPGVVTLSRVGKKPIPVPPGVEVRVSGREVWIKGTKGELKELIPEPIEVLVEKNQILVRPTSETREAPALHGLVRSKLANMVLGVTHGFSKSLEIQGLGYRAQVAPGKLTLQLGYSHPVNFLIPPGIQIQVDPKQSQLTVSGADKHLVGEISAQLRILRPPEPYKGTGIRYSGERVLRKAGKTAAGVGGAGVAGGGAKKS